MTHLFIDLYDRVGDRLPCGTIDDHEVQNRQYFHDLRPCGLADLVDRVVIRRGDEYRAGDHIRLLDQARPDHTSAISIDPLIADDVDLHELACDDSDFADRVAAVLIVTNPNRDSSYRLRVSLYDRPEHWLPALIFYDWERLGQANLTDLNRFHFANKAAFIRVEAGPTYQPGDRVILWESLRPGAPTHSLAPGEYDLCRFILEESEPAWLFVHPVKFWAGSVAGIELDLRPQILQ